MNLHRFRAIGIVLLVAAALRLLALPLSGHGGDVTVMARWAERMADVGPWAFYDGSGSIYPALLYPLWALGSALDGDALRLGIKALSIPMDLALGTLLFAAARSLLGDARAVAAAALYLLNPAVILAGPGWGQVDAAGALPLVASLVAAAAGQHRSAGFLAVLAALVKPQFGLALLPVFAVALIRSREARGWRPVTDATVGASLAYLVVAAPLALTPGRYLELFLGAATLQPYTSLNAFNPWGLLVGFEVPDGPYVAAGAVLLLGGLAAGMLALRRGRDLVTLLAVGALLVMAFYFLPTRVHERYLFSAMALLAPLAVMDRTRLAAYVTLSAGFAASLLYALHTTTRFRLPSPIADAMVTPIGVWVIGMVLIGSALAWVWMLLVRPRGAIDQRDAQPSPSGSGRARPSSLSRRR